VPVTDPALGDLARGVVPADLSTVDPALRPLLAGASRLVLDSANAASGSVDLLLRLAQGTASQADLAAAAGTASPELFLPPFLAAIANGRSLDDAAALAHELAEAHARDQAMVTLPGSLGAPAPNAPQSPSTP